MNQTMAQPRRVAPASRLSFRGQQPGETVVLLTRGHRLVLIARAWPALLASALLVTLLFGQVTNSTLPAAWTAGEAVAGLVALGLLLYWAFTAAIPWWYHLFIITNRRVISSAGIIAQDMDEIDLRDVQAVRVEAKRIDEWLWGYGRVTVAAAGGRRLSFAATPAPQEVATLLTATRDTHAPTSTRATDITDPTLRQVLDTLARPETLPPLDALPRASIRKWPLSRAFTIKLDPDEALLGVVSRHWWALALPALPPLLVLVGALLGLGLGVSLHARLLLVVTLAAIAIGLIWLGIVYLNFADDVFVFTSRRLIDVQRRFFILYEIDIAIEYTKIQEIETSVPTLWARLLHFGTLQISAAGLNNKMLLDLVPEPNLIEQAITHNRVALGKIAAVATTNREKTELKDWFAAVLGEMVIAAPELRGLTFEAALEQARHAGLRPTIMGESYVIPGVPAGTVISQSPMPGARVLRGGDVSLVLSKMW